MIDPKAITTYAQYNEDLILAALLSDVKQGFYVDIGANYPVIDSVTEYFYQKGWHGINIEPLKKLHKQLAEARPKDINLNIGIGETKSEATFREYVDVPGQSTFDPEQKKQHAKSLKYIDYTVRILPLSDVLAKYNPKHIHFMKIDVEGFEYEVVAGNNWEKFRPDVVCIEANHVSKDWRPILVGHNYKLFIADGLNEYYVAQKHWNRTEGFVEKIVELDYHALKQHQQQSWHTDSEELVRTAKVAEEQQKQIQTHKENVANLQKMAALTLKNRPWFSRFKRAIYGLTVDWVRYKKSSKKNLQ